MRSLPSTSIISTIARPTQWTIAIVVTVSSPDGEAPFNLQLDSPVVLRDVAQTTTITMRATANSPGLAVFSAEVFTTRLHGAGTLDVVGPGCPATYPFAESPACSADPLMVPIGVSYQDFTGPKPTGQAILSTAVQLLLIADALRSGTYHLADSGFWQVASDRSFPGRAVNISIDFTVTGPS